MSATQLGVDVGGTFTDVVLERPNDAPVVHKVSSTPDQRYSPKRMMGTPRRFRSGKTRSGSWTRSGKT